MKDSKRTPAGTALTTLILDLFSLNNRLLAAGDRLVAKLGLTSARWQVLGTIVAADRPHAGAWLARDLGAHRPNLGRIGKDSEAGGMIRFAPNPAHRRGHVS